MYSCVNVCARDNKTQRALRFSHSKALTAILVTALNYEATKEVSCTQTKVQEMTIEKDKNGVIMKQLINKISGPAV